MVRFHSEVQHTKITVSWTWRTLVKVMMPCGAEFLHMLVVGLTQETGCSPMELEFPHQAYSGNSIVYHTVTTYFGMWFICTAEEVVWLESSAVKFLVQQILSKPYTLEYTQQTLVSGICNKIEVVSISSGIHTVDVVGSFVYPVIAWCSELGISRMAGENRKAEAGRHLGNEPKALGFSCQCSTTELWYNHQLSQACICTALVVLNAFSSVHT